MRNVAHDPRRAHYESLVAEREQLQETANSLSVLREDPTHTRWWYAVLFTVLLSMLAAAAGAAFGAFAYASLHGMCSHADLRARRCH